MKKLIIGILLAVFLATPFWGVCGDKQASVTAVTAIDGEEIAASESYTSSAIDLSQARGYFSIQYTITGNGTVTLSYTLSNDGTTYLTPSGSSSIATGLTKTSGPGGSGKDILPFTPPIAKYMKIVATETGGVNSATVTSVLNVQ